MSMSSMCPYPKGWSFSEVGSKMSVVMATKFEDNKNFVNIWEKNDTGAESM